MSEQLKKQLYAAIFQKLTDDQKEAISDEAENLLDNGSVEEGYFGICYCDIVARLFFGGIPFLSITMDQVAAFNGVSQSGSYGDRVSTISNTPQCASSVASAVGRTFNTSKEVFRFLADGGSVKYRNGDLYKFDNTGRLTKNGVKLPRKECLTFAYFESWTQA